MAAKKPMIKPSHKGRFTAYAKAHGETVPEAAKAVLHDPHASTHLKREAQFAENARTWDHGHR